MILKEILNGVDVKNLTGDENIEVSGVSFDSNKIKDGYLFIALKGGKTDGHKYICSAIENGASCLILENPPTDSYKDVTVVQVKDSRAALAVVSANFFRHPTDDLMLVGITGTNGKTTITYLLESIWKHGQKKPGVIGTIDYRFGNTIKESSMTTPESSDLMAMFREMKDEGVEAVAMEVSSHAIDKNRVAGCEFDAAVFTNLTQDHLDYHHSMEDYFNVKKRLFTEFLMQSGKKEKFSVINIDDPYGERLAREVPRDVVTYAISNQDASVYASSSTITENGIEAVVSVPGSEVKISSTLFGAHNLSNILAAVASAVSLGSSIDAVEKGISEISSVPGRLESVPNSHGFKVLVDYAHTPDALKNVLLATRTLTKGRLILVFGCGGDRDNAKRPQMGKIGKELSDVLFITSDNPRTEDPEIILDHIEEGVMLAGYEGKPYSRIANRKDAIMSAIRSAKENDTVLIAGKGHEDYQIIGTTKYPFDDRKIAKESLKDL